jgi:hypothetical protein
MVVISAGGFPVSKTGRSITNGITGIGSRLAVRMLLRARRVGPFNLTASVGSLMVFCKLDAQNTYSVASSRVILLSPNEESGDDSDEDAKGEDGRGEGDLLMSRQEKQRIAVETARSSSLVSWRSWSTSISSAGAA